MRASIGTIKIALILSFILFKPFITASLHLFFGRPLVLISCRLTQHAKRMRRIFVVCELSGCTIYFEHYLINGANLGGKKILNIKCAFWFYLQILSEKFFILRRIQRDIIINVHWSSCAVLLFLSGFIETWTVSTVFRKILACRIISSTNFNAQFSLFINNMFVTILSSTCFEH